MFLVAVVLLTCIVLLVLHIAHIPSSLLERVTMGQWILVVGFVCVLCVAALLLTSAVFRSFVYHVARRVAMRETARSIVRGISATLVLFVGGILAWFIAGWTIAATVIPAQREMQTLQLISALFLQLIVLAVYVWVATRVLFKWLVRRSVTRDSYT